MADTGNLQVNGQVVNTFWERSLGDDRRHLLMVAVVVGADPEPGDDAVSNYPHKLVVLNLTTGTRHDVEGRNDSVLDVLGNATITRQLSARDITLAPCAPGDDLGQVNIGKTWNAAAVKEPSA